MIFIMINIIIIIIIIITYHGDDDDDDGWNIKGFPISNGRKPQFFILFMGKKVKLQNTLKYATKSYHHHHHHQ